MKIKRLHEVSIVRQLAISVNLSEYIREHCPYREPGWMCDLDSYVQQRLDDWNWHYENW